MTTPVIVLPGVMGSRLHLTEDLCWDPDSDLNMVKWRHADLAQKRRHLSVTETPATVFDALGHLAAFEQSADEESVARARGWAGLAWGFYGPALRSLHHRLNPDLGAGSRLEEFPVYAFGYDWRASNLTSAHQLVEYVDATLATTSASKVILVTHSMGGLVARAAIASDPNFVDKVHRVVHVGQPADGAPTLYRRFLTGVVPEYDVHAPLTEVETWLQEHVLAHIIGTTPEEFATLMSVLPGPMQLLPSARCGAMLDEPWLADDSGTGLGGASVYDTYRRTDEFGIMKSVAGTEAQRALERQLRDAEQFHALIGGVCHPSTFCIYGTGIPTDRLTRPGGRGHLVPRSLTGDGTVDESCACGATFDSRSVRGVTAVPDVDHSKMLLDDSVMAAVCAAVTTRHSRSVVPSRTNESPSLPGSPRAVARNVVDSRVVAPEASLNTVASVGNVLDTTDEAREVQIAAYRAMTPSQRVEIALQLSDDVRELSRSGIRWRHPELDERDVHHEFLRILYGSELAAELIAVSAHDDR